MSNAVAVGLFELVIDINATEILEYVKIDKKGDVQEHIAAEGDFAG